MLDREFSTSAWMCVFMQHLLIHSYMSCTHDVSAEQPTQTKDIHLLTLEFSRESPGKVLSITLGKNIPPDKLYM